MPTLVQQPNLANSPRIDTLVNNGVLELSLKDAISLALENNLDIAIARYNLPIAEADVMRTRAGGLFRGVNTGVVQNTPGAVLAGLAQVPPEQVAAREQAVQQGAQAARAQVLRAWCRRRLVPEPMCRSSIP